MPKANQRNSPRNRSHRTVPRVQKAPTTAKVQEYKAAFMQRLGDHVRFGYTHWTSGVVSADRAQSLAKKFHSRYGTELTRHQKAYARGEGQASAALILWSESPGQLRWVLMLTPGDNLAHELEHLKDATTAGGRIVFTGYEMVQLPRRGSERPAWTWRMTSETYDAWRERILRSARRGPDTLSEQLAELARTPGFAGCRAQVRKLLQLAHAEARRRLGAAANMVGYPAHIGYVQRLSQSGLSLPAWIRQQRHAAMDDVTKQK